MNKYIISILVVLLLLSSSSPVVSYHIQEGKDSPSAPIIEGPQYGQAEVEYEYTFTSIDPNGDNLSYLIDWGDGNEIIIGPFPSGEQASATHKWDEPECYTIRAQAIDEFGEESQQSRMPIEMLIYYLEDVNILMIARCRTMGCGHLWLDQLFFIGEQAHFSISVHHRLQRAHVIIYNESASEPYHTLFLLKDVVINMRNVSGFFFINTWKQFSVRLFPYFVFVKCHTDKLWIRDIDAGI